MIIGPAQPGHPDAVTYLRAARAFRERDLDAITETIHESVVWHFPGNSWLGREVEGRTALMAYVKEIVSRTGNSFVLEDPSGIVSNPAKEDHFKSGQRMESETGDHPLLVSGRL